MHLALVVALSLLLAGCQTWGPTWSEVTGVLHATGEIHQYRRPAIIEYVDDQGSWLTYPIKIDPGMHRIVLSGPTPGWIGTGELKTMMVDVAPCKRYYFNAQFESNVGVKWEPVLAFIEDIPGCTVGTRQ